LFTINVSLTSF